MPTLVAVDHAQGELDAEWSHITDLHLIAMAGTSYLVSTTRHDGVLRSWGFADDTLTVNATITFEGGVLPAGTGSLVDLNVSDGVAVLTGGGASGGLQTVPLLQNGTFGATVALTGLPAEAAGFQQGVTVALPDGTQAIYGTIAGSPGMTRLDFAPSGQFIGSAALPDPGDAYASAITALVATTTGPQTYLISASATENGITTWSVAPDGAITMAETMGTADGLWIAAPTALATAVVGGENYIVLGAAGSQSLSVIQIGTDGGLIIRDHLMDTRDTRFGGVAAVEIVTHGNQTYVIAGGADDGISVFLLLEGGMLLPRAHIADTTMTGLANVSAIAARSNGDQVDIFVASSAEVGVTYLRFDPGPTGISLTATLAGGLLSGTAGADILQGHDGDDLIEGHAGEDIIRDGAGSDQMTGGAGADVFILTSDGATDTITDFTLGEDRLDLSLWPMLRDISQLAMQIQTYGVDIRYGDELLIVQSADGQMIDYRSWTTAELIGGSRISQTITPGYPGPARPPPDLDPPGPISPDPDAPFNILDSIGVVADAILDGLRSGVGNANGDGTDGHDLMVGGSDAETLQGGAGNDVILGRGGNDTIFGGAGSDLLVGGAGDDRIEGSSGDDLLLGGAGADTFVFNEGYDRLDDFEQGIDTIALDPALWTGLTSAADLLRVYGAADGTVATIDLGDGNVLRIANVMDFTTLYQDIDLF